MKGHLQTAGAEHYNKRDTTTGGTSLFILSMCMMNRRVERTQFCQSPTLTLKSSVFIPLRQTLTSECFYNDLIAANS